MKLYPPWHDITNHEGFFERELERELHSTHFLYGKNSKAIAKFSPNDDVAFRLMDGSVAVVHLTYSVEKNSKYPSYSLHENIESWCQESVVNNFYDLIGLSGNESTFTLKIIDVFIGHVDIEVFEQWVYKNEDLETELGADIYLELLAFDFKNINSLADILNPWYINKTGGNSRDLREIISVAN